MVDRCNYYQNALSVAFLVRKRVVGILVPVNVPLILVENDTEGVLTVLYSAYLGDLCYRISDLSSILKSLFPSLGLCLPPPHACALRTASSSIMTSVAREISQESQILEIKSNMGTTIKLGIPIT